MLLWAKCIFGRMRMYVDKASLPWQLWVMARRLSVLVRQMFCNILVAQWRTFAAPKSINAVGTFSQPI